MNLGEILVLDENDKFRKLNTNNFNDDIVVGTIFFTKEAISVIQKFCLIIGYVIIDKKTSTYYPIDIHVHYISMFEGVYNCLPNELREKLIKYNLKEKPGPCWTKFFFDWQFMCSSDCFNEYGPLIKLSSSCLSDDSILKKLITKDAHLVEPINYNELSIITKKLFDVFQIDIKPLDYELKYKYLLDSLLNYYFIKLNKKEILKTFYFICDLCNKRIQGEI